MKLQANLGTRCYEILEAIKNNTKPITVYFIPNTGVFELTVNKTQDIGSCLIVGKYTKAIVSAEVLMEDMRETLADSIRLEMRNEVLVH